MSLLPVFIGFFVGIVVGLTGVGGGSIMTPILVAVGINPVIAVGSDLAMSVPTRLYGAFVHHRQKTVKPQLVKALCWGGIPGALAGMAVLYVLRRTTDLALLHVWLVHAIGASLFLSAGLMIVSSFVRPKNRARPTAAGPARMRDVHAAAIGALVGFIVSITSIGSGSVTLPLLTLIMPSIALPELVGSDIAFSAFLVPAAALGHWSMGDVDGRLTISLIAGSLPGVFIGTRCCRVFHERWLRGAVALVLCVVGARLIAV